MLLRFPLARITCLLAGRLADEWASCSSSRQAITPSRYHEGMLTLNHITATGRRGYHTTESTTLRCPLPLSRPKERADVILLPRNRDPNRHWAYSPPRVSCTQMMSLLSLLSLFREWYKQPYSNALHAVRSRCAVTIAAAYVDISESVRHRVHISSSTALTCKPHANRL